jgi:hypothetical protein
LFQRVRLLRKLHALWLVPTLLLLLTHVLLWLTQLLLLLSLGWGERRLQGDVWLVYGEQWTGGDWHMRREGQAGLHVGCGWLSGRSNRRLSRRVLCIVHEGL